MDVACCEITLSVKEVNDSGVSPSTVSGVNSIYIQCICYQHCVQPPPLKTLNQQISTPSIKALVKVYTAYSRLSSQRCVTLPHCDEKRVRCQLTMSCSTLSSIAHRITARLVTIWLYLWNFRYLPIKQRLTLVRLRRRFIPTKTGLRLRGTIRRAHELNHLPHNSPWLFVLRLFWPFPTWRYHAILPASPRTIVASPSLIQSQWRDLTHLRSMPLWKARDTPQRSFYRLYEAFCARDGQMISSETEYFWHHSKSEWAVVSLPDPQCRDEEQYAVMASLAEVLVLACNWRNEIGLRRSGEILGPKSSPPKYWEETPTWTANVAKLDYELVLDAQGDVSQDNPFKKRGIIASTGSFYTV